MKQLTLGIILTMAVLASPLRALAQAPPTAAPETKASAEGPRIRFSETSVDFGKIKSSDLPVHNFFVTNVGDAELEIKSVVPGCGCTTASEWDRKIQPGKTGKIPIQFNPSGFRDRVTNKYVAISCNDPKQPTHTLYLAATVWRPIDVQPAYVYFTPIESEATNDTKSVRIISDLPESVTLEQPQCTNSAYKMELKTRLPGKEFELLVSYEQSADKAVPVGQNVTEITIKTSSTNMPKLNLLAYAVVQPALVAMPSQVRLPASTAPAGYRQPALIRNMGRTPVTLSEPSVNAKGIAVHVVETQPGRLFTLNMDIPPNFQVPEGLELTVKTTHPKYPVFRLPILPPSSTPPIVVKPQIPPLTNPK